MSRVSAWTLAAVTFVAMAGCIGCSSSDANKEDGKTAAKADQGGADVAVFTFLKAVQEGKDKEAADMLTRLAREKTAEMDMVVAPPGSDTASFEVGEVELINDNGAYVSSTWTDVADGGQSHSDQIVWVCRKEPEGWRIAGMVTKFLDSKLVLNFEDPQDMMRKQELAEKEMMRRMQQQAPAGAQQSENGVEQQQTEVREVRQPDTTGTIRR